MNEIIFILHALFIALCTLGALALGQQALVAFVCIQSILANLFVIKQITLFGLPATATDVFTIGATLGLNLLQEYCGKEIAKKTIGINFFLLICYTISSQIQMWYTPSIYDTSQEHFVYLLTLMPRIMIASLLVYALVQILDYHLYGMLKKLFSGNYLVLRNYISIAICQLIDTVLFSFLGLYGIVHNIQEIIIVSYSIKLAALVIATPFVKLSHIIRK